MVADQHKSELLTKCKVKMAGYLQSSLFTCLWTDRDRVEVHKLTKKEWGQYQAILTEQAWSIMDLLYGFQKFFLWDTAGSSKWAR